MGVACKKEVSSDNYPSLEVVLQENYGNGSYCADIEVLLGYVAVNEQID